MRLARLVVALALAACGGKQPPVAGDTSGSAEPVAKDTRTPFEKQRDAACTALAPKLTSCAVEDAKADLDSGKTSKAQFDKDTAPEVQHKNSQDWIDKCTHWRDMSSRQVRVLEVCFKEESQCGPLADCLKNLEAKQ